MDYFTLAMQEYNALRTEINNAMTNQQSILNYGVASIGIIFAFTASNWQEVVIVDLILLVLIPLIALLVCTIWLGEVNRIARAGKFLVAKEKVINDLFLEDNKDSKVFTGKEPLIWENYLRDIKKNGNSKSIKTIWNYRAIIFLMVILSISSISIGIYHNVEITNLRVWIFIVPLVIFMAQLYMFRLLNKIKKGYTYVSVDGGGTTTRIVIQKGGSEITKVIKSGLNYKKNVNYSQTFKEVAVFIDKTVGINKVDKMVFGVAGLDNNQDSKFFKKIIYNTFGLSLIGRFKTKVVNDIYLVNALGDKKDKCSISVICGTGSNIISQKGRSLKLNRHYGLESKGGIRHIVDYLLHNADYQSLPRELKEALHKYQDKKYDIDDVNVINDFKKVSYLVLDKIDNNDCKEACLYGIDSMIESIKVHEKRLSKMYKLYLFGGQFNALKYRELFEKRISEELQCFRVVYLGNDASKGGFNLMT